MSHRWSTPSRPHPRRPARGAALLLAMVLLTVVATLAAGMVWQQWRSVQVEAAERSRAQSAWVLLGAQDWARLILRADARSSKPTSLDQPWATPLAEARLSTFLAADRDNNADGGPEAFLAGSIADVQARYNLANLVVEGKAVPAELEALRRLCQFAGLAPEFGDRIAAALVQAAQGGDNAPLPPQRVDDLRWAGLEDAALQRLAPLMVVLPEPTKVNLNTAPREVLAAVIAGLDLGGADRLVQARQRKPFGAVDEANPFLPSTVKADPNRLDVNSRYFEIRGRLRLEDRVLEEQSLVKRDGLIVRSLQRQRQTGFEGSTR